MLQFTYLDPRVTEDRLGFISEFLSEDDPRSAVEQINERYAHGGGWRDMKIGENGFRTIDSGGRLLKFPGDPPLHPYAEAQLHGGICEPGSTGELILIYECAFVAVFQTDGSFRVARLG